MGCLFLYGGIERRVQENMPVACFPRRGLPVGRQPLNSFNGCCRGKAVPPGAFRHHPTAFFACVHFWHRRNAALPLPDPAAGPGFSVLTVRLFPPPLGIPPFPSAPPVLFFQKLLSFFLEHPRIFYRFSLGYKLECSQRAETNQSKYVLLKLHFRRN